MPALFLLLWLKDGASSNRTISALFPSLKGFLSLADVSSSILLPCCSITYACAVASRGWAWPGCLAGASGGGCARVGRWGMTVLSQCPMAVQTFPFFTFLPFFPSH